MSTFFGVPLHAAYHLVFTLSAALTPLLGGLAASAAIVLFTMAVRLLLLPLSYQATRGMDAQARMAPQVQALRKQHAGQPDRLHRELTALYQAEGAAVYAGCLPALLQWPFFSIMYLLFRSPDIGRVPNALLAHHLLGAPLASHWLGGPGPFSAQGAVFAGLFALLACIGWLSARVARHAATASASGTAADQARAGYPALARIAPYLTVVIAAFLPLAAGLYLVTTTAWTLAERITLRRFKA
jgi:YidC/Oxa1 family membrane protein insertase